MKKRTIFHAFLVSAWVLSVLLLSVPALADTMSNQPDGPQAQSSGTPGNPGAPQMIMPMDEPAPPNGSDSGQDSQNHGHDDSDGQDGPEAVFPSMITYPK